MKRQAALVSLGLIAGLGLGYAVGAHRAGGLIQRPPQSGAAPQAAPAPTPRSAVDAPGSPAGEVPTSLTAAAAKQKLADWVAAGCPDEERWKAQEWLSAWSLEDASGALAFVAGAARFPLRNPALVIPLAILCRKDPAHVRDWLYAKIPEQERGMIAEMIIRSISAENPREALMLAEAEQMPVSTRTYGPMLAQLLRVSVPEALAAFNRLTDGGRQETAGAIARAWAAIDSAAALRWAESLRGLPGAAEALTAIAFELAEDQPDQALALMRNSRVTPGVTSEFVRMMSYRNPKYLLSHIEDCPAADRAAVLTNTLPDAFSDDPDRLAALARSTLPASDANRIVSNAWQRWLEEDRPAAEAWAAQAGDPTIRASLELVKLRDTANTDPSLFLSSIDNYPAALTEKPLIAAALDRLNSDEAGDWIARHPGVVDPEVVATTAGRYFGWNRAEALVWAQSLPPGPSQNQALASIAQQWTNTGDSAQAATTISAITDQRVQTGTRFKVFASLYRKDRSAATQWLAAQPVTPEIRANWETLAATITDNDSSSIVHLD